MPVTKDELEVAKLERETAKIELEIANLRKPYFATPSFWISSITALVAVAGVYGQSVLSRIESAQAVVDRDMALLAKEIARKDLEGIELERASKKKEVLDLTTEADALRAESKNQSEKLVKLLDAVALTPQSGKAPELRVAAQTATKSLFSTAVYAFNVDRAKFSDAVSALSGAGYSLIKTDFLGMRHPWLSSKSVVLYYDDAAKSEAQGVAALIAAKTGLVISVERGAGAGIPAGKEKTSLRVHLVQ